MRRGWGTPFTDSSRSFGCWFFQAVSPWHVWVSEKFGFLLVCWDLHRRLSFGWHSYFFLFGVS